MATVYRIRNWSKHFENNKSRGVESCRYVCMPNKQDGLGLTRILAHADGRTIFGVWCLILQACSRQAVRDGWLTDDGKPNGRPWDIEDLALRWRCPVDEIQRCIDVVCSPKIGWMEGLESKCPPSALQVSARCLEGKEGKEGKEGNADCPSAAPDDLFSPSQTTTSTDPDAVAFGLTAWVQWRARDPQRERENVAELASLVATYGPKPVQAAAERTAQRERRKAWPNEILPDILAQTAPAAAPSDDRRSIVRRWIDAHGVAAVVAASGLAIERQIDATELVEALTCAGSLYDTAAAKLGA